ncbi:anti-sigma factor domain-containing protein [Pseudoroseicyclus sp. CXY001]|uniref:anti-sigma factor n=1 Tax=Pseudoroseicyclus sp. CXY001 TaxID=3242492 RepID=UPI003571238C
MSDRGAISGEDPRLLAAEYALGLLPGVEARAFEALMASDPALAGEALAWGERLALMADAEVTDVAPPARLKRKVEAHVFGRPQRRGLWAGLGALAVAALVVLAVLYAGILTPGVGDPEYVADVAAEDRSLVASAAYQAETGALVVRVEAGAAPEGRDLELWAIVGEAAPVSLGVIGAEAREVAIAPELAEALGSGVTLAITDEPPGGSPSGQPTGAIHATGVLTAPA